MSRRAQKESVGVALFPFLAVLICTMGSLIVLLVLMVQDARDDVDRSLSQGELSPKQNDKEPAGPTAEELQKAQEAADDARWRAEMLAQQREEKVEALAKMRLQLSHLEEHIRRLQKEAQALVDRVNEIDEGKKLKDDEVKQTQEQLAELKKKIDEKKKELEEQKKNASKEQWYALIPYDGPNGTRRRPFYIECVEEGIIIQPEGLLLTPADFNGPLGPGNPLDAALRAKREYIQQATNGQGGEPYPLLVVRPSGVLSYSAARAAMKAWDEEFGYELISDEKMLDFGPRDPELDKMLAQTVTVARKRQAMLAAAMPRRYQDDEPVNSFNPQDSSRYDPATSGSAAPGSGIGGGTGNTTGSSIAMRGAPGPAGNGLGDGGTGGAGTSASGTGGMGAGTSGRSGSGSLSLGNAGGGVPYPSSPTGGGTGTAGANSAAGKPGTLAAKQPGTTGSANSSATGNSPGTAGTSGSGGSGTGTGSGGTGSGGTGNNTPGGVAGGTAGSGSTSAGGGAGGAGSPTQPGQMAVGLPTSVGNMASMSTGGMPPPTGTTATDATQGVAPKPGMMSSSSSGSNSSSGSTGPKPAFASSNTRPKGSGRTGGSKTANWGLPDAKNQLTGITRPIRISCQPDKLVILPDKGEVRQPTVIPISPEMSPAELEKFVSGIQKNIRSWGLAVAGGYWKPELNVEVAPNAETRFTELQTALQGSGFDIKRKIR